MLRKYKIPFYDICGFWCYMELSFKNNNYIITWNHINNDLTKTIYEILNETIYLNSTNSINILCVDDNNNYYYYDTYCSNFVKLLLYRNIYFIENIKSVEDIKLLNKKYNYQLVDFITYDNYT